MFSEKQVDFLYGLLVVLRSIFKDNIFKELDSLQL